MTRRYVLALPFLLPLAVGLVLPACTEAQLDAVLNALGEGCLIDSDCEGELVCVFRRCHHECETDKDCTDLGVGPFCRLGDRPTNVCLLEDEQQCQTAADCPGTDLEVACSVGSDPAIRLCRDRCQDSGGCLPGQSCLKGVCANEDEEGIDGSHPLKDPEVKGDDGEPCIYNSQCLSPLACIQGLCRVACIDNRDCPANGTCEIIPECAAGETPAADGCAELPETAGCVAAPSTPPGPTGPLPAHCSDGATSGDESGVDCGGSCAPCPSGGGCGDDTDCQSGVCSASVCQAPTCSDGARNGTELGVDCGGHCPAACPVGTTCTGDGDCTAPATCNTAQGICVAPECSDGLLNNAESDIDCGGPNCAACDALKSCVTAGDCASLVCASGTCLIAGCSDGVKNGLEADVDCGGAGSGCAQCGNGATCAAPSDCTSGSCAGALCSAATCSDGVHNGLELGVDCGGPTCTLGCALGNACTVDSDCDQTSPAGCHPTNLTCTALRTVTVALAGSGTGTVTSTPAGIDCGAACDTMVFDGASIQLDATPDMGGSFEGFGGDCAGASPCVLAVSGSDATVSASFGAGGSGLANWDVQPMSVANVGSVAVDSSGHIFAVGEPGATGDWGCGPLLGINDFTIVKYVPGLATAEDACLASVIDGGPNAQDPVGLVVDDNDDVVVLFSSGPSFTLAGQPEQPCPTGFQNNYGVVWYDGSLTQTASKSTPCYGPMNFGGGVGNTGGLERLPGGDVLVYGTLGTNAEVGAPSPLSTSNGSHAVVRYSGATGNYVSHYQFGGNSDSLRHLTVDEATGDIVITMGCTPDFSGIVDFGSGVMSSNPSGNNSTDICAVKLNELLVPQWAYQVGSASGNERGVASAFVPGPGPDNDVIVTGYFSTLIHFGDGIFHPSVGLTDIAVIHVDGVDGTLASTVPNSSWRAYGTPNNDEPAHIAIAPSGAIYLTGGTADAGGIDVGGGKLTAGDRQFLAKYTSFGVHEWSTPSGGTGNVGLLSLTVTGSGVPLVTGFGTVDWGTGTLGLSYIARFTP